MTNTFFRDVNELPDPEGEDTRPIIVLPTLPDDPTPIVTLTDGKLIVAHVRIGSIVHRLMLAKGYKVAKS